MATPAKAESGPAPDGLPAGERRLAMLSVAAGVGMASLDTSIANTALPAMALQLQATPADSVWIVTAYQLAMVATLLPFAALSEIVGYKKVNLAGLLLFAAASLACALAPNLPVLIGARLAQGLGASAIMSVNGALLRVIYPSRLLGQGFGTNALVVAVAFSLGPALASAILSVATWPWLFGINIPFGAIALILGWRALPRRRAAPAAGRTPYDVPAALCNIGAFGLLIFAVGEAAHHRHAGVTSLELVVAAALLGLQVRRERSSASPIFPVDLFRRPLFSLSALTATLTFATQSLGFVGLPFFFEAALHRSAVDIGLLITPWPVVVGIMAPIAGRLSDRYPPGALAGIGLAMLSAGMAALATLTPQATVLEIAARMTLCGMGFGFFQAPNLKAMMSSAPPHRSGGASGIIATARLTGQASGAALAAFCLSLSVPQGARYALWLAAVLSATGSIVSVSRLFVRQDAMD
ncbi:MFS transporter [Noviherbaspirillum galbum]|uniref:MFS transporter n=1 Tax=Noviherbaspirillum galbum TaxID=2709383 RepID=A0A6B3SVV6_9BURK|nr:MFS transporter [Noviherbaspirillum galbum]NEX64668.1 MFS transporter [Noviherbaspirillum galbum]